MSSLVFWLAITKERATSTALSAKVSSANTPTAWLMAWLIIIPKHENELSAVAAVSDRRRESHHTNGAQRAPLQLIHCIANIFGCYVIGDISRANARRDDETDFSAFEFFVEFYRIKDFLSGKFRW